MGTYLSTPVTETIFSDETCDKLRYGSGSMQGWRVSQEDAHCAIINYDDDTQLFAVFDGHGGSEVAQYSAHNLHKTIKSVPSYKSNDLSKALEDSFLEFDSLLTRTEVMEELKVLAGTEDMDEDNDDSEDEANMLRMEANIPIEDLLTRYTTTGVAKSNPDESELCSSSSSSSSGPSFRVKAPLPSHMRHEMINKDKKPLSPFFRSKQFTSKLANDELGTLTGMCSSSSSSNCTITSSAEIDDNPLNTDNASNGETKINEQTPDSTIKSDSEDNKEKQNDTSQVTKDVPINEPEPSSLSNGKSSSVNETDPASSSNDCQPSSSLADVMTSVDDGNTVSSGDNQITTSNSEETVNDGPTAESTTESKSDAPESSSRGKGKQRKQIQPKRKVTVRDDSNNPIYETFMNDFDNDSEDDDESDDYDAKLASDDDDDDEEDVDDEETSEDDDDDDEEEEEFIMGSGGYEEPGRDSGCTAVVALLRGNQLYVANAGDSRCVVCRDGKVIEMSFDHKPEDDIERSRIVKAGGKVTPDGRVNGGLNLSRAIGDHAYKCNENLSQREQMITALPDIKTLTIEPADEFMVLACDGIWNSLTSQQVVDFVKERISKAEKLSSICEELFKECLAPNTNGDGTGCDNMTCIIVKFENISRKRKNEEIDGNEAECVQENDKKSDDSEPIPKRVKIADDADDVEENSPLNCSTTVC